MGNLITKRFLTLAMVLCMIALTLPISVMAATVTASVTGPSVVRAGDTITVTVKMSGTGVVSARGEIQYDASQLEYKSNAGSLSGWAMDIDGSASGKVAFLGIDDKLAAPINGNSQLFVLSFAVKASVASGAKITVTAAKMEASDGTNDFAPASASYSVNTAAPLSGNVLLSALTVSNATITPAFNKNTTDYTATVPFSVAKLEITATAEDAKSKVAIAGNALTPGGMTNVTITLTAESGAKKTYTIKVTREKDPNYQAGNNTNLSGITVDGFRLSPAFNPETKSYIVWLPYEVDKLTVSGQAADGKATVSVVGGDALIEGQDNVVKVICTAENGTKMEYLVIAKRASANGLAASGILSSSSNSSPDASSSEASSQSGTTANSSGMPVIAVILIGLACLALGGLAGYQIKSRYGNMADEDKTAK